MFDNRKVSIKKKILIGIYINSIVRNIFLLFYLKKCTCGLTFSQIKAIIFDILLSNSRLSVPYYVQILHRSTVLRYQDN